MNLTERSNFEECRLCPANSCKVLQSFDIHECPCISCIVKIICSEYCDKYYLYAKKYHEYKEGTKMGSGKQLKLPNVNTV